LIRQINGYLSKIVAGPLKALVLGWEIEICHI
jgi:hypothetical protein